MPLISTGAAIGGALIGGISRLGSTLFGNAQRRQEQRRTERREDTAVQRRVADLQRAGLSPTLAAGSAATTAAPPQIENPDLGGMDPAQMIALKQGMADVARTEADTELANVMAREHSFGADLKEQEWLHNVVQNPMMLDQMRADLAGTNLTNEAQRLENEITREYGKDAAKLKNDAMTLANQIVRTHGMNEAQARVIGLRLANDQARHNLQLARKFQTPVGGSVNNRDFILGETSTFIDNIRSGVFGNLGGRGQRSSRGGGGRYD